MDSDHVRELMSADNRSKGKAALAAAARAFAKAQQQGNVWISDQGTFETFEMFENWAPAPSKNPDQLRLV